ncbi:MAG: hypothetical protein AAGO57_04630 [Pseudomonadota bacterium]
MEQDWVILRLTPQMLQDLRALSRTKQVSPGQVLRDYIARETQHVTPHLDDPLPAKHGTGVSMLRELIEDILFTASDWTELQKTLMHQGFALRVEGFGLMMHAWPSDEPICKTGDLGFCFAELIRRIGKGEPPDPLTLDQTPEQPLRQAV